MNINLKFGKGVRGGNILWGAFAIVMVVVFIVLMIKNPRPEHIEDTNGTQDYTLQTITEQDVLDRKMGSRGAITQKEKNLTISGIGISSGREYSAKKFTGVQVLHTTSLRKGSDLYVSLAEFEIREGNFVFYIVYDEQVIGQIHPRQDGPSEFILNDVDKNATLEYVIAGESASFRFIPLNGFE